MAPTTGTSVNTWTNVGYNTTSFATGGIVTNKGVRMTSDKDVLGKQIRPYDRVAVAFSLGSKAQLRVGTVERVRISSSGKTLLEITWEKGPVLPRSGKSVVEASVDRIVII